MAKKVTTKAPNEFITNAAKQVSLEKLPDGLWRLTNAKTNLGEEVISNQEALIKAIYEEGQERGSYDWKEFGLFSAYCTQQMVSSKEEYFNPMIAEIKEIQTKWLKSGDVIEKELIFQFLKKSNLSTTTFDNQFWSLWTDYLNSLPRHQRAVICLLNGKLKVNFFYGAMIATGLLTAPEFHRLMNPSPDQIDDWDAYKATPRAFDVIQNFLDLAGSQ